MKIIKKIGKWFLFIVGGIIGFILLLLLIIRINSTGVEEPFLNEDGEVLTNSIAIHEDIIINGAPQRLTIRGKDIHNPVLLNVHGGPGGPMLPILYRLLNVDLEDLFTVCYWEQRGAGTAYYLYNDKIPDSTITLEQIVDDGLKITHYLKQKFNKDKIYIEGVSWGTTVSAFMVQKRPELFQAYIGIGQMANQPMSEQMSYDFVMNEALKHNDTISIKQLKQIGRPPYPDKTAREMADACDIERLIVDKYTTTNQESFNFKIVKSVFLDNGLTFKEKFAPIVDLNLMGHAYRLLWPTCFNINLMRDVPEWKIPVYIIQGEHDHYTETPLAKAYFDSIVAPEKKWFLFEDASHAANFDFPEKYRSIYINDILK